jgi:thymidylate synthase ThyX
MNATGGYHSEDFTDWERSLLSRFFTNLDSPVFAIVNLPEVVKGALFARYSRSPKSLRRLFLDEFVNRPDAGVAAIAEQLDVKDESVNVRRASELYDRMFMDYGDDSVAQLGGAHVACEQASNILTKVLERGRLAAYLEQSTRYIYFDKPLGGSYRYMVPSEISGTPLGPRYRAVLDGLFDTYRDLIPRLSQFYEDLYPRDSKDSEMVWRSSIRARVCDDLRGLLPAATLSNVGIFATAQAYEALLLRMRAHRLAEVRDYGGLLLEELRKVIPAFLKRVDLPERGVQWSEYFSKIDRQMESLAASLDGSVPPCPEVDLIEWDSDAELKIAAAALYEYSDLPDDQLLARVREMSAEDRRKILSAYIGERRNRRHKPGRAFERTYYRFDILASYSVFRDLQRHRLLTLEWQKLSTVHGYDTPEAIETIGAQDLWHTALRRAGDLYQSLKEDFGVETAQYVVPFAYRVRFNFHLNAREAFHLIELRTQRGGDPAYRRICQTMHRLIRERAGHHLIADAMTFVDHEDYGLGRLDAERRTAERRAAAGVA